MSDRMVERVARAIAKADARAYEDAPNLFRGKARAAIEAMREPTGAMYGAVGVGFVWADWDALIDAALNEVTG